MEKKVYLFIDKNIDNSINEIIKYKNISIIYRNYSQNYQNEFLNIYNATKKHKIPLFVSYHQSLIKKYKVNGFYIPSFFKKKIYVNSKIFLIGSAHNYREIYEKQKQGCKIIFISPMFGDDNKKIGVIKFNLITNNFKSLFCGLGGINIENIKRIQLTKSVGISGIRIINNLKFINKLI